MKTTRAIRLAFLLLAFLPSMARAAPILDAHLHEETGAHLMSHGADWRVQPDRLTSVTFTAQHPAELLSIDLWLAARSAPGYIGQPQAVTVELWQGDALLGSDQAGADVPFVWRGDLWNGQFPFNSGWPQGYNQHAFEFPGVTLTAGRDYEFRVSAAANAPGS